MVNRKVKHLLSTNIRALHHDSASVNKALQGDSEQGHIHMLKCSQAPVLQTGIVKVQLTCKLICNQTARTCFQECL